MSGLSNSKIFKSKLLDSKVTSANTQLSEMWLGYFFGPCFVFMAYYGITGYLNQFYTDVLGMSGAIFAWIPLISKIVDAITNIAMGRIIDKTRTRQGKARPWLIIGGLMIAIAGILLYTVPTAGYKVQVIWIIISYNLFYAFAFTIYNMAHSIMVPLSTRNTKQRDTLALLTSNGIALLPGTLTAVVLPILVNKMGVGAAAQGSWITIMSILSIIVLPATLLEYYFTKERVTEENINAEGENKSVVASFSEQVRACFSDKYWLMIMAFWIVFQIGSILSTTSLLYYSNWVLASSVEAGTTNQLLLNMIGQSPMGLAIFVLWPLVKKFGKRRLMLIGFVIGAVASLVILLNPKNLIMVLVFMFIRSIGTIPTFLVTAQIAEALDHIEWNRHFRVDGFSTSIQSVVNTVAGGICSSIILGGISRFGYIAPDATTQVISQPQSMQNFFVWCFVGVYMISFAIGAVIMHFYRIEDKMPTISAEIIEYHRKEAEKRGEVYVSPEEKAAMEQERLDRIAEEKRITELKEKCAKKGLNFEEEEEKYQNKIKAKKK